MGSGLPCLAWAAIFLSNTCGLLVFRSSTAKTQHSAWFIVLTNKHHWPCRFSAFPPLLPLSLVRPQGLRPRSLKQSTVSSSNNTEPLPCTFILGTQPSAAILNLHLQRLTPRCCLIQLPLPKGSTANNQLLMPSFQHAPFTSQSQFWLCCQEEKCDFFFSLLNLSVIVFNVQLVVFKFHLQFCSLVPSNY